LRNDAQVFVHGQNLGGAGPEDRLRIGQDDLVHNQCSVCFRPSCEKLRVPFPIFAKTTAREPPRLLFVSLRPYRQIEGASWQCL
jgi:hypothetical protein